MVSKRKKRSETAYMHRPPTSITLSRGEGAQPMCVLYVCVPMCLGWGWGVREKEKERGRKNREPPSTLLDPAGTVEKCL